MAAILLAAQSVDGDLRCVADSDTIEAAIGVLAEAGVDELVIVLGEPAGTLAFQIAAPTTTVRRDAAWQTGWARGIRAGFESLQPDAAAVVLATVDVEREDARLMRRTLRRFHRGESGIFVFDRNGAPGLPVLADRRYRNALLECGASDDPAACIAAHPDGCVFVSRDAGTPNPATE